MELIIDDRERQIVPHIEEYHNNSESEIPYKVKRLEVGDYAINYRNYILFIIERKTWNDLAASLRDGRKANINKLLHVREKTGCQLIYLIEGPAYPPPTKKFNRMPAKHLIAHLDHIAFRDGIHMQFTKDCEHTARRLFELARNYSTIKNPSPLKEIDDLIDENTTTGGDPTSDDAISAPQTSLLTEKQSLQISVQEQLLQCMPSIGCVVSNILTDNNISFFSLYSGQHGEGQLSQLQYSDGRKLGLKRSQKIINNFKMIKGTSALSHKCKIRILSSIKGVSPTTAKLIADAYTLEQLMNHADVDTLKNFSRGKTKLGVSVATSIISTLRNNTPTLSPSPSNTAPNRDNISSD